MEHISTIQFVTNVYNQQIVIRFLNNLEMNHKLILSQLLILLFISITRAESSDLENKVLSNFKEQNSDNQALESGSACTPGCMTCSSYGCITCYDGYYLETNLQCVKCPMKDCVTCNNAGCLECPTNYFLFEFNCVPCQQKNCPTCNGYGCTSCFDGFYLQAGVCILCQEHCKLCNAFGCQTCKDGYFWDGKHCQLRCNVPNCQTCDRDGDCVVCQIGYTLQNFKCIQNKKFLEEGINSYQ
ncbi:hypothetical protein TTHERM_000227089 (macronuclear) [Tetrahymena thermophila SB210]|uniref:EGF-like domain-containing protein n=1 Tax=Tetrahymena thermophila (strain SB210) TaxID=312017 RepID=W7XBL5_TETTS|nr:hypothetical protein TTHERM_000227089 [Tetrahymena thermophila SB210]EWS74737.1 hypothetical protein TTHERM_000227089 [Tetrahymena thermophila SB210]|eukprot:XP_012652738.1 hypothetical protein TTHERM_000227089 [Tetrahymena thermophila SB210]